MSGETGDTTLPTNGGLKNIEIRLLGPGDAAVLDNVRPDTFDHAIIPAQALAFVTSPLHKIVVALDQGQVIALASGVMMFHPDKEPVFFINEVGVHEDFQRRGIGRAVTQALIDAARADGSSGIWLATEVDNKAARGLYCGLGARKTSGVVVYDWDGAMDD